VAQKGKDLVSDHYSFPIYEVVPALRDARVSPAEPFSRSLSQVGAKALGEAAELLSNHLIHNRKETGITDEELDALRSIRRKLEACEKADLLLRRKQDLILRCMHPDGCYHGYLSKEIKLRAYELAGADPLDGLHGLHLGWENQQLNAVFEFLAGHVERLQREDFARCRI
jgi:hypothetical protein